MGWSLRCYKFIKPFTIVKNQSFHNEYRNLAASHNEGISSLVLDHMMEDQSINSNGRATNKAHCNNNRN